MLADVLGRLTQTVLESSERHQDLIATDVQLHKPQELPIGIDCEAISEGSPEEVIQAV
jgi:hypothetical protein